MILNNTITLLLGGDFCSRPSATNIKVDDKLREQIQSSDLAIVNFETPLLPKDESPIERRFFQHHDSVQFLKDLGFALFNICNNHILDYGTKGVEETINMLGVDSVMGLSTNEVVPYYKEVKGQVIAFLPLCYDSYATDSRNNIHVNSITSSSIQDVIRKAKSNAKYVIVLPHDGIEYVAVPTPYIRSLYKQFVDWGADAVVAAHPHCIQGMEIYNDVPIIYSMGNLFFNSKNTLDFVTNLHGWYYGMMVKLSLSNGKIVAESIFTENVRNRELILDCSSERRDNYRNLCNILTDDSVYESYIDKVMNTLLYNKYLPTIDCLFRIQLRSKKGWKYLLKQIYASIRNRGCSTAYLKFILRSNTERNMLVESLNKML